MSSTASSVILIGSAFARSRGGLSPGGLAAELAIALAAEGCPATPITRVGDDEAGRSLLASIAAAGLPVSTIQVDRDLPTARLREGVLGGDASGRLDATAAFDLLQWDGELSSLAANCSWVLFDALGRRHAQSRGVIDRFLYEARSAVRIFDLTLRPPGRIERSSAIGGLEHSQVALLDAPALAEFGGSDLDPPRQLQMVRDRWELEIALAIEPASPLRIAVAGGEALEGPCSQRDATALKASVLAALIAGGSPTELLRLCEAPR